MMEEHSWSVTFSIGLAIFAHVPESDDEIISFTDNLMYRAKSSGKNKVLIEVFCVESTADETQLHGQTQLMKPRKKAPTD